MREALMRKVPKKITHKLEQKIIRAIEAATIKSDEFEGFLRFDYEVDWSDFPTSLKLIAVFNSQASIAMMQNDEEIITMEKYALNALMKQGVRVRDIRKLISFVVEADR